MKYKNFKALWICLGIISEILTFYLLILFGIGYINGNWFTHFFYVMIFTVFLSGLPFVIWIIINDKQWRDNLNE